MLQQGAFPFLSLARAKRESKYEIQVIRFGKDRQRNAKIMKIQEMKC